MSQHIHFKFSITVHSDDLALIASMRGLAWFCQDEMNRQISVDGAKQEDWSRDNHEVKFYFTSKDNRQNFINVAINLFRQAWKIKNLSDDNPPTPQV